MLDRSARWRRIQLGEEDVHRDSCKEQNRKYRGMWDQKGKEKDEKGAANVWGMFISERTVPPFSIHLLPQRQRNLCQLPRNPSPELRDLRVPQRIHPSEAMQVMSTKQCF
jgi:hypothetical protein